MNNNERFFNRTRVASAHLAYSITDSLDEAKTWIAENRRDDEARTKSALGSVGGGDVGVSSSESAEFMRETIYDGIVGAMRRDMFIVDFNETYNPAVAADAHFVMEGRPIPISKASITPASLPVRKVASLSVYTKDALRQKNAVDAFAKAHATEIRHTFERQFIDPDATGFDGESPRSVSATPGVVSLAATSDPAASFKALLQNFTNLSTSYLVMHPETAVQLNLATVSGASLFPDVGARGGQIAGVQVVTSQSCPFDSTGGSVILLDASKVVMALGGLLVTRSFDSTIQMVDELDSNGNGEAVDLFSVDGVAIKTVQYTNWSLADAAGCRVLTGAGW